LEVETQLTVINFPVRFCDLRFRFFDFRNLFLHFCCVALRSHKSVCGSAERDLWNVAGHVLVKEYIDDGYSGTLLDRLMPERGTSIE
jgi:hypothetical protein